MIAWGEIWYTAKIGITSAPRARAMTTSSPPTIPNSTWPEATICTTGTPGPPFMISTSSPARLKAPPSRAA
jgi:hypothetical protein